jgi:hypothetical protein
MTLLTFSSVLRRLDGRPWHAFPRVLRLCAVPLSMALWLARTRDPAAFLDLWFWAPTVVALPFLVMAWEQARKQSTPMTTSNFELGYIVLFNLFTSFVTLLGIAFTADRGASGNTGWWYRAPPSPSPEGDPGHHGILADPLFMFLPQLFVWLVLLLHQMLVLQRPFDTKGSRRAHVFQMLITSFLAANARALLLCIFSLTVPLQFFLSAVDSPLALTAALTAFLGDEYHPTLFTVCLTAVAVVGSFTTDFSDPARLAHATYERRMKRLLSRLQRHTIIVGYESLGREVVRRILNTVASAQVAPQTLGSNITILLPEVSTDWRERFRIPHLSSVQMPLADGVVVVHDDANDVDHVFDLNSDVKAGIIFVHRYPSKGELAPRKPGEAADPTEWVAVPVVIGSPESERTTTACRMRLARLVVSTSDAPDFVDRVLRQHIPLPRSPGPGPTGRRLGKLQAVIADRSQEEHPFARDLAIRTSSSVVFSDRFVSSQAASIVVHRCLQVLEDCAASQSQPELNGYPTATSTVDRRHTVRLTLLVAARSPRKFLNQFVVLAARTALRTEAKLTVRVCFLGGEVDAALTRPTTYVPLEFVRASPGFNDWLEVIPVRGHASIGWMDRDLDGLDSADVIAIHLPEEVWLTRTVAHMVVTALQRRRQCRGHRAQGPRIVVLSDSNVASEVRQALGYYAKAVFHDQPEGLYYTIAADVVVAHRGLANYVASLLAYGFADPSAEPASYNLCLRSGVGVWASVLGGLTAGGDQDWVQASPARSFPSWIVARSECMGEGILRLEALTGLEPVRSPHAGQGERFGSPAVASELAQGTVEPEDARPVVRPLEPTAAHAALELRTQVQDQGERKSSPSNGHGSGPRERLAEVGQASSFPGGGEQARTNRVSDPHRPAADGTPPPEGLAGLVGIAPVLDPAKSIRLACHSGESQAGAAPAEDQRVAHLREAGLLAMDQHVIGDRIKRERDVCPEMASCPLTDIKRVVSGALLLGKKDLRPWTNRLFAHTSCEKETQDESTGPSVGFGRTELYVERSSNGRHVARALRSVLLMKPSSKGSSVKRAQTDERFVVSALLANPCIASGLNWDEVSGFWTRLAQQDESLKEDEEDRAIACWVVEVSMGATEWLDHAQRLAKHLNGIAVFSDRLRLLVVAPYPLGQASSAEVAIADWLADRAVDLRVIAPEQRLKRETATERKALDVHPPHDSEREALDVQLSYDEETALPNRQTLLYRAWRSTQFSSGWRVVPPLREPPAPATAPTQGRNEPPSNGAPANARP